MKKHVHLLFLVFLLPFFALAQTFTLSTMPTSNGGNGQSGISFNVGASSNLLIKSISASFLTGAHNVSVWYKTTPINGTPGAINAASGWNQIGTTVPLTGTTAATTAPVLQQIPIPMNLLVPAGQTYGFVVITSGTLVYTTYTAAMPVSVTDGRMTIFFGPNVGYGGNPPTIATRSFVGSITYELPTAGNQMLPPIAGFYPSVATPTIVPGMDTVYLGSPQKLVSTSTNAGRSFWDLPDEVV
ncbi:MAG: hypothetical protein L6Q78_16200, partial [Bacteroidia bacterium]|nr:hypothetical protein [Bacteroidia bacterium]